MAQGFVSTIIPVFTAVFSVFLTILFREKQRNLNVLRALRTEMKHNDDLGESMFHDLFSNRSDNPEESELRSIYTVPLQTSAYHNFVNSGIGTKIDNDLEDKIWYHYLVVRSINRSIERRREANYARTIQNHEDEIIRGILYLSDFRRLQVIEENMRNEQLREKVAEAKERQKSLEENNYEGVNEQTYTAVSDLIQDEIEDMHWMPKPTLKYLNKLIS